LAKTKDFCRCEDSTGGKCTDCNLPRIETTDCGGKSTDSEKNAQIVILPRIETTDCRENAQTVRKMHKLYIYLILNPQTKGKK
jgi:hypothetical protein